MQQNDRPDCFGQLWSVGATECTGGYDVAYTGPTGSHIRPRCDHFEECGRAVRNRTIGTQLQQYQPPRPPGAAYGTPAPVQQQYARPPQPIVPSAPQPVGIRAAPPQQMAPPTAYPNYQYPQPGMPPGQYPPPYPYPPPNPYYGIQAPVVAPQLEMMPKNWFSTPSVLATHEPRQERPWASFWVEIARGMGMISGLVSADFFSNVSLLKKPGE